MYANSLAGVLGTKPRPTIPIASPSTSTTTVFNFQNSAHALHESMFDTCLTTVCLRNPVNELRVFILQKYFMIYFSYP